ncbi:ATPase family associated with various cellular activities (AAA) [Geodermatophilus obscurus]|uniref:ATPase family associated with various cellular activities (AAA) n=1 Tax=Geodermatophilus obscurus TaxID=1861 RepID=A0A1I5HPH5_9ACTN|nr:ATP-binding protein [Geodermatophilus obscurus]SFO50187.1 ATPase family associated with various cellular activities (AAA) [Geodermatophilus obscurus]
MAASPFAAVPLTPAGHFRVNAHAATFHLLAHLQELAAAGALDLDETFARHPFLTGYLDGMCPYLPKDLHWAQGPAWWAENLRAWERAATVHLPLAALDATGLGLRERHALVLAGLVEEDSRFGSVFAEIQRPIEPRRPTLQTLAAILGDDVDPWSVHAALTSRGLVETVIGGGPRSEDVVTVPAELWAVLRGTPQEQPLPWGEVLDRDELDGAEDLLVPDGLRHQVDALVSRLGASGGRGAPRAVLVRGAHGSGRRRVLGALARGLGRGALFVDADHLDDARWARLGALCTALGALPVVRYALLPGQAVAVPAVPGLVGVLGLAVGSEGGLTGRVAEAAIRLDVPRPGPRERRAHWLAHLPRVREDDLDGVVDRHLLPGGQIRRAARRAREIADLDGRGDVVAGDVGRACAELGRERLDVLAQRLDPPGGTTRLVCDEASELQLLALELRCRHRERVLGTVGPGFGGTTGTGVRALLTGPSGTGKTLACRLLAAQLGMDLYRVDLAAVIDKYVGETEKNLHRILSAAEELDVVLLVDEGDSLLGNRTEVRSANDRFANLETNYLLQRLETYQGIVLVTTNAAEGIDPAFQRRMDVVLTLVEPGPMQRWELWQLHLPADHRVSPGHLDEVAARAEMTGGQIRNAAMQATFLALDDGHVVDDRLLDLAVAVEYGKAGAVSPFQRTLGEQRRRRSEAFLEALP